MKHLLEVLKIIDGAVNANYDKVTAYSQQLAQKLEAEGDGRSAASIRRSLTQSKVGTLSAARLTRRDSLPIDNESRFSLADEHFYDKSDVHIFLPSTNKATLEEFLRNVKAADKLIAEGVGISPSLLLYGPPGCGKTELGKYISAQLSMPLITARTDSLISSYLGNTAKNLRLIFEHVANRPCVLLLDELDAIAKLRDDKSELGELKRVVVSLLQNLDSLGNKTILVGATNHEHLLDAAVWRRFAYKIKIGTPDESSRVEMFRHFLGRFGSEDQFELYAAASETLTGSEIKQICEDSKREAILRDAVKVSDPDLLKRIIQIRIPAYRSPEITQADQLKMSRELSPKVFTYRRLSEIHNISVGHISNLLKK